MRPPVAIDRPFAIARKLADRFVHSASPTCPKGDRSKDGQLAAEQAR